MKKRHFSKRLASLITTLIAWVLTLIIAIVSIVINQLDSEPESVINDITDVASQVIAETSAEKPTEETSNADNEDSEESGPKHCFVQNKYGYTFIYGDSGYEQFNYSNATLNNYIESVNTFSAILSGNQVSDIQALPSILFNSSYFNW